MKRWLLSFEMLWWKQGQPSEKIRKKPKYEPSPMKKMRKPNGFWKQFWKMRRPQKRIAVRFAMTLEFRTWFWKLGRMPL